jgi:hypothetical protein
VHHAIDDITHDDWDSLIWNKPQSAHVPL